VRRILSRFKTGNGKRPNENREMRRGWGSNSDHIRKKASDAASRPHRGGGGGGGGGGRGEMGPNEVKGGHDARFWEFPISICSPRNGALFYKEKTARAPHAPHRAKKEGCIHGKLDPAKTGGKNEKPKPSAGQAYGKTRQGLPQKRGLNTTNVMRKEHKGGRPFQNVVRERGGDTEKNKGWGGEGTGGVKSKWTVDQCNDL